MQVKKQVSKQILLLIAAYLYSFVSIAQTPKGFVPDHKAEYGQGRSRAIIIGISKYEYIDSLQYADKDAIMFADYLQQTNFWNINKNDITLLINEKAKYGNLTVELQKMAMASKPGDNLLFYFSGHGDVETQTLFNRGYLLAYDTYSSNYMANGLRVDDLKDLFTTLLTNNVKVILVTDACRSGKLAGGLKGIEYTATAISSIWKNEIKILSSQPGQLSFEDKKWGNGRGVFSYYLIKGLNGAADIDKDSLITLSELETYVGINVAKETGNKQQPLFEGPNKFSTVITNLKGVTYSSDNSKTGNNFTVSNGKINISYDSCEYYFRQMNKAISVNNFKEDDIYSASSMYIKLKSCTNDSNLILAANATLLTALINKTQEIINNSFIGKNLVPFEEFEEGVQMITQILRFNQFKYFNKNHWVNLKRYLQVQGNAVWFDDMIDKLSISKMEEIIDSAIADETDAAYLIMAKAILEMRKENWKQAISLLENALEKSPTWLIPKYYLGICYSNTKSYAKAISYYDEILQKDTSYTTFECTKCILGKMAEWSWDLKKFKQGVDYYLFSIDHFPDYWPPYEALYDYSIEKKDTIIANELIARFRKYDDTVSMRLNRIRFEYDFWGIPLSQSLPETIPLLKDNIDSADYYYTMAVMYKDEINDEDSAIFYFRNSILLDSTDVFYLQSLVDYFNELGYDNELQELIIEKISAYADQEKLYLMVLLADSYIKTKNLEEAFNLIIKLKDAGGYSCTDIKNMKKIFSSLPSYQEYMKTCTDNLQKKPASF